MVSWFKPLQFAQGSLEPGNHRGQFLAGSNGRVARQVAGLEQLLQWTDGRFRRPPRAQVFFDCRFGNGGGGQVQPLA